jgi:hypothetical protein
VQATQHHMAAPASPSGERALHAPQVKGGEACTLASKQPRWASLRNTTPLGTNINKTKTSLANSFINVANLNTMLEQYRQVNNKHAMELKEGFSHGFRLGYECPRQPQKSKNLVSVADNVQEVKKKIQGEIDKGRVEGPFDDPPIQNLRCSPIGLVPKKAPGEFRLIHHLSWPEGKSVNNFIDPNMSSVKY